MSEMSSSSGELTPSDAVDGAHRIPDSAEPGHDNELPADRASADIGIVCTHAGEIRAILKRLDRVRKYTDHGCIFRGGFLNETIRVALVEARMGFARHRQATLTLIREHRPAWVLSVGFSSGLNEALKSGDLTLANEICDSHTNVLPVNCRIPASRRVHIGRHLVSDHHPIQPSEKASMAETSRAIAVDTTSLAVAQVCRDMNTRFMSIRAIVDELPEEMPEQAAPMMFEPTSRAFGSAIAVMLKGWKNAAEMHRWRQRSLSAADHLDRFVSGVILQIAEQLERQRHS